MTKQEAQQRWEQLSQTFEAEPLIHEDMRMMHDYYGVHTAVEGLSKEHLREFLLFRFKFLEEELNEGFRAVRDGDAEEVVDALIDLIVVAAGTLDLYGVDFKRAWNEVLKANMNKEVGVKASRPNPWGLPDLIKLPGWVPPSHADNHGKLTDTFGER